MEAKQIKFIEEFNSGERSIHVNLYMEWKTFGEIKAAIDEDTSLAIYAVGLITAYLIIFLGSCSPTHCRISLAIVGVICILLSVGAGFGIGIKLDYLRTEAHEALPILMLGIGVDDMFIICNALD